MAETLRYPKLYKRLTSGNIQCLVISARDNELITEYGVDGGATQVSKYPYEGNTIKNGEEQAKSEAKSKFDRLIKYNGYRPSVDQIDTANFIKPMKAHKYEDHKHKLKWPLYVQPKLNGMRCLAFRDGDQILLTTGLGNDITTMDHIKQELLDLMEIGETWDGELYYHGMPLNQIMGIVKANKSMYPLEEREQIQYHVFDCILDKMFNQRADVILQAFIKPNLKYVCRVDTRFIYQKDEILHYGAYINSGYEGMMYRNNFGLYTGRRSYDILKRKDFKDDEFKILRGIEGAGKLEGCLASFECEAPNGQTFRAPMNGDHHYLEQLWVSEYMWLDKWLTVKYLELSEYGIPQIPKGIAIRDGVGRD